MNAFEIASCTPELRSRFAEIWVPWLRSMTGKEPEPEDLLAVGDPESFYIRGGGTVLFALRDGDPLGVVAVRNLGGGIYEFGKLVVLERARGLGVGRRLVEECIRFARNAGGRLLMLQSFRRLEVALRMYERMGFIPMAPPPQMLVLSRTEIVMGMALALGPPGPDR
jgi:GNAT superfamily N-acetyltransferase